jgi:hypothetical protein
VAKCDFLPRKDIGKFVKKIIALNIIIYMCVGLIMPGIVSAAQTRAPYTKGSLKNYPGYENLISALQSKHPNWNFTILNTGLDWNDVIKNETVASHGRNLVYYTDSGNWVCSICGNRTYDTRIMEMCIRSNSFILYGSKKLDE